MSLRISEYNPENAYARFEEQSLLNKYEHIQQNFHYWRGASGKRYLHTIYSLLECPLLPKANYIMVRRDEGKRIPLRIGCTVENACSLNLAYLRQKAAQLGANEIHIHLLCETSEQRMVTQMDLRAGLFSHLAAENTDDNAPALTNLGSH